MEKKKKKKKREKGMYTQVWCSGNGLGMGPTKSRKIWVMRCWKYVPNVWSLEILGILSDEWEVRSDGFLKTKQPLVTH